MTEKPKFHFVSIRYNPPAPTLTDKEKGGDLNHPKKHAKWHEVSVHHSLDWSGLEEVE